MASFIEPLVVGRVVGEVVDLFVPTINMSVNYGSKHVNNGCEVKPSIAVNPPTIHISGKRTDLYTLVMTDPDAPSPSDPRMKEVIHWLVVDIPGGTDPTKGHDILPYMGPHPPVGIHRYVFVLFQQRGHFPVIGPVHTRAHFNTRLFSSEYDLGLPVATVFFNSQKEPASRRR